MSSFLYAAVASLIPSLAGAYRSADSLGTMHMVLASKGSPSIAEGLSTVLLQRCNCSLPADCSKQADYSTCYCDGGCPSGFCKYVAEGGMNYYQYHRHETAHWGGYCQDRGRELHHRCDADRQCAQGICNGGRCKGCDHLRESGACGLSEGCVWARDGAKEKCRLNCFLIRSQGTCKSVANPLAGIGYCEWKNDACEPSCESVRETQYESCADLTLGKCIEPVEVGDHDCQERTQLLQNGKACKADAQCASGICLDAGYDLQTKKKAWTRKLELTLLNTARVGLALLVASLPQFVPPMLVLKIFKTPQKKPQCRQLAFDPLEPLLHDTSNKPCRFYSMEDTDVFCAEREMDETEEAKACTTSASDIKQRFDNVQAVISDASEELSSLQSWLDNVEDVPEAISSVKSKAHLMLEGTDPIGWTENIIGKVNAVLAAKKDSNERQKKPKAPKTLKFPSAYDAWYIHGILRGDIQAPKVQYQLQCFDVREYLQVRAGRTKFGHLLWHPKYKACRLPCETKNASDAYRLMNTASIDNGKYVEFLPNKVNFGNFPFENLHSQTNWCEATLQGCEIKKHNIREWWACVGDKARHVPQSNTPYLFADPWTNPRCGLMNMSL